MGVEENLGNLALPYGLDMSKEIQMTVNSLHLAGLGSSTVLNCTWYLYLSTYLSVLDVLEYLVYGNAKVLVLVLDQKVLGTYK